MPVPSNLHGGTTPPVQIPCLQQVPLWCRGLVYVEFQACSWSWSRPSLARCPGLVVPVLVQAHACRCIIHAPWRSCYTPAQAGVLQPSMASRKTRDCSRIAAQGRCIIHVPWTGSYTPAQFGVLEPKMASDWTRDCHWTRDCSKIAPQGRCIIHAPSTRCYTPAEAGVSRSGMKLSARVARTCF